MPVIVWTLLSEQFLLCLVLFSTAGFSDFIDGWLARFQKIQTSLGAHLDPLADKILMSALYATLALLGHVPIWFLLLIISRDLIIILAIALAWLLNAHMPISPLLISKINTFMQIGLGFLILVDLSFVFNLFELRNIAYILVGITTVLSAISYLIIWITAVFKKPNKP